MRIMNVFQNDGEIELSLLDDSCDLVSSSFGDGVGNTMFIRQTLSMLNDCEGIISCNLSNEALL